MQTKNCQLCKARLSEKLVMFDETDTYAILPTKDKKGHKFRYMVVSLEHTTEPCNPEQGVSFLFSVMKQFGVDFTIMEPDHATVKDHWHRVASDFKEDSKDVEQMVNTNRIEVRHIKAGDKVGRVCPRCKKRFIEPYDYTCSWCS